MSIDRMTGKIKETMYAADMLDRLLDSLLVPGRSPSTPQMAEVWAAFQQWIAIPVVPTAEAKVEFEGFLIGGADGLAGHMDRPPGVSSEFVCCFDFVRSVQAERGVVISLYFPADEEWWKVARAEGWNADQPFVVECWCPEPGPYDRFIAEVEESPWFQLALRRQAEVVVARDSTRRDEARLDGDGVRWFRDDVE